MSIMRVTISSTYVGQVFQNVLHFSNPDGAASHLQIRDDLFNFFLVSLRNLQNIGHVYTQLHVQTVSTPQDIATIFPITAAGAFSGAGAHVCIAAVFSIRTGTPGRHGHGRFYMGGVQQDSVVNSAMAAGTQASYALRAGEIVTRYNASGPSLLILGVAPRDDPSAFIPMTNIVVRPVYGIQRRRNIGVGG